MGKTCGIIRDNLLAIIVCLVAAEAASVLLAAYGALSFKTNAVLSCLLFFTAVCATLAAFSSRSEDYDGNWHDIP